MAGPRSANGPNGGTDHKDYDVERQADHHEAQRNQLTNTVTLSSEMFENLYLSPKGQQPNDLRKMLGNPTPVAIMGFVVGLTPLSCEFMTWRGSGGFGVATGTDSLWFGGLLLILAGIGEFILGNTFPFVVFMGYGAHFLTYSTTFMPAFNTIAFYNPTAPPGPDQITPTFAASYAFYPLSLAILSFIFLIGSLRTNVVFVFIFICATIGFSFAAAAFWFVAEGATAYSTELVVWTGACFFAASMLGWYLLLSIIVATMELPVPNLPVFDLSTIVGLPMGSKSVSDFCVAVVAAIYSLTLCRSALPSVIHLLTDTL